MVDTGRGGSAPAHTSLDGRGKEKQPGRGLDQGEERQVTPTTTSSGIQTPVTLSWKAEGRASSVGQDH